MMTNTTLVSFTSLILTSFVILCGDVSASGFCSSTNCEGCSSASECDKYDACDYIDNSRGFKCLPEADVCTKQCYEKCDSDDGEGLDSGEGESGESSCYGSCYRECHGIGGGDSTLLSALIIGNFFACLGFSIISGNFTYNRLEKEKRKYYRENGDKVYAIVHSKEEYMVEGGWNLHLTIEVQTQVNGEQRRARKKFRNIERSIYKSVMKGGPIAVTSIARLTGDPRHVMLSDHAVCSAARQCKES